MRTIDNVNLAADLVDLCEKYGWTAVGQEHDILYWLENRLREADSIAEDDIEDLRERAEGASDLEDRVSELERIIRKQADALREMAKSLRLRSDELVSMAQQHEAEADD